MATFRTATKQTLALFTILLRLSSTLAFSVPPSNPTYQYSRVKNFELKMTSDDKKNLIMVVGSANQDLTSNTDVLPIMGETVMGQDFATACGGKGANQAVAAASLQLAPVAMVCRVGDDIFGQNLLANFSTFSM